MIPISLETQRKLSFQQDEFKVRLIAIHLLLARTFSLGFAGNHRSFMFFPIFLAHRYVLFQVVEEPGRSILVQRYINEFNAPLEENLKSLGHSKIHRKIFKKQKQNFFQPTILRDKKNTPKCKKKQHNI